MPRRETGESSQSRSPEQVERPQSDASHESPGMRDVLRNHNAFSTVASPETSGLASQRNMDDQENLFSQSAQEAKETPSTLDGKMLKNIIGGVFINSLKSYISCGKPTSSKLDKLQDPDLARDKHSGSPLTYEEAHQEFRKEYPVGHGDNSPYRLVKDHSLTIKGEPVARLFPKALFERQNS